MDNFDRSDSYEMMSPGRLDSTSTGEDSSPTKDDSKAKQKKEFPWKLHEMLEEAQDENNEDIVAWNPDGVSFKVFKPEEFVEKIMPRYFNQTQFRSFQRMVSTAHMAIACGIDFLLLLLQADAYYFEFS